jgi:flagellar protein FlaI
MSREQSHTDTGHTGPTGTDLPALLGQADVPVQQDRPSVDPSARVEISYGGDGPATLREAVLADVKAYFAAAPVDEEFADPPTEGFVETSFFDFSFLEGYEDVEHYWVQRPYAFVSILYDQSENVYRYHVSEPTLDPFESFVRSDLTKVLRNSLLFRTFDRDDTREGVFTREAKAEIMDHAATVEGGSVHKVLYYLLRNFVHFGRIDPIMRDPDIEDISCDGDDVPVFVYHGTYRDLQTNVAFGGAELTSFTVQLAQRAGKQVSVSDPLVDASLTDGSRVQLTLGTDVSTRGSNFTIRKFSEVPFTPVDLVRWNTFSVEEMAYFWLAIENNRSLLFAGGTGSGKTTSMNAVSFFIPQNAKVVSIEDTREITLPHDNWIQSVTRDSFAADDRGEVSMYRLLQASLRQRPEYLLVGEIRTEERVALTFFHSIATGHTAYSTVHADSIEGVLNRLRNEPLNVPPAMLEGLDIVSVQRQVYVGDDRIRRNMAVVEIIPGDGEATGVIGTSQIFRRDPGTDGHERVGDSRVLAEIADEHGWDDDALAAELARREAVLRYLVDNDVTDYHEVASLIHAYGRKPEAVMDRVGFHLSGETDLVSVDGRAAVGEGEGGSIADGDLSDLFDDDASADGDGGGPSPDDPEAS